MTSNWKASDLFACKWLRAPATKGPHHFGDRRSSKYESDAVDLPLLRVDRERHQEEAEGDDEPAGSGLHGVAASGKDGSKTGVQRGEIGLIRCYSISKVFAL